MNARGRKKPIFDRYGNLWRFVAKSAVVSAATNTNLGAAIGATAIAPSAGIQIKLLANQAIRLTRYQASLAQSAATMTLIVVNGTFQYLVSPYAIGNGIYGFAAIAEYPSNTSGAVLNGQYVDDVGVNFDLVDDWLEYDDTPINTANSISAAAPIQLQTFFKVQNVTAVARTVSVGELAAWEIWESIRP